MDDVVKELPTRRAWRRYLAVAGLLAVGWGLFLYWSAGTSAAERWMNERRSRGERFTLAELGVDRGVPRPDAVAEAVESASVKLAVLDSAGLPATGRGAPESVPGVAEVRWRGARLESVKGMACAWVSLEAAVATLEPVLVELHELLREPPRDPGWDYGRLRLFQANYVARRQVAQSLYDIVMVRLHQGQLALARRDLVTLIHLGEMHAEGYTLVNQIIRNAIRALGTEATWQALQAEGWGTQDLIELRDALAAEAMAPELIKTLEVERAMGLAVYDRMLDGESPGMIASGSGGASRGPSLPQSAALVAWRTFWSGDDRMFFLRHYDAVLSGLRRWERGGVRWPGLDEGADPRNEWSGGPPNLMRPYYLFSALVLPNWSRALRSVAEGETQRQMALADLGARLYWLRHAAYPNDGEELVPEVLSAPPLDYLGGEPLQWKAASSGPPSLYSLGRNGVDDGGDPRPAEAWGLYGGIFDGRDAVWPRPYVASGGATAPAGSSPEVVLTNVAFTGARLLEAMAALAREAGVDLVIDPAVTPLMGRTVSVRLGTLTARQGLHELATSHGLRLVERSWTNVVGVTGR